MCDCAFWNDTFSADVITHPSQQFEQWAWESFGSLSTMMDAYSEQERSQLALIQRFLAGGFSLSDHQPDQPAPHYRDSYADTMKDLRQLPWLERFVSVISDNYYDEYIQWDDSIVRFNIMNIEISCLASKYWTVRESLTLSLHLQTIASLVWNEGLGFADWQLLSSGRQKERITENWNAI